MAKTSGTTKVSSSSSPKGLTGGGNTVIASKQKEIPAYERYEVKNALSYIYGGNRSAERTKEYANDTAALVKIYNQYQKTIKNIPKDLYIGDRSRLEGKAKKELMSFIEQYADKRRKEILEKIK